jgi:oligosaccharide repeat unit polymerase
MDFFNALLSVAWFLLVLYIVIWIINRYSKRRVLSVLSFTVFMQLGLPMLMMYPFSYSERNIKATGHWYYEYLPFIDDVLIICIVGVTFFFLGVIIANSNKNKSFKFEGKLSEALFILSKPIGLTVFGLVVFGIYGFLLYKGVFIGEKGLRAYAMQDASIRPIYNTLTSLLPLLIGLSLLAVNNRKSFLSFLFLIIAFAMGLTTGSRTTAFAGILFFVLTILFVKQKEKNIILKTAFSGVCFLILMMYVSDYRTGQTSFLITLQNLSEKILFGNTFSDFRDTAWIMAGWEGQFLFGKTQLAGILSFIPSSMLPFRSEWSLGVFTTSQVGLNSSIHPGLRPVIFGEAYFNFGIPGVIIFSLLYGYIIGRLSMYANSVLLNSEDMGIKKIKIFTAFFFAELTGNIMITAGFFYVYVVFAVILLTLSLTSFFRSFRQRKNIKFFERGFQA